MKNTRKRKEKKKGWTSFSCKEIQPLTRAGIELATYSLGGCHSIQLS